MDQLEGMPTRGVRSTCRTTCSWATSSVPKCCEAGPDTDAPPAGTLVTSIPVLLSAKGFDPIVYSNTLLGGYAERMLLSAPLLLNGSQRA